VAGPVELIGEEPLSIRIDDRPYVVVMRTPGDEVFQAAGFCLGEGIADSPDDFETIGYDEILDPNMIDVWLGPGRRLEIHDRLERRGYISQTSCGICGKAMLEDLEQRVSPARDGFEIHVDRVFECMDELSRRQRHYETTRCSHAALIFDEDIEAISLAEDVGRHNALDKAIGRAFLDGTLVTAGMVALSSRNSYEMTQKAARARVPVVVSNSRPTALAVEMGRALNMTLAYPDDGRNLVILCGEHRIRR
jgi:FdhD protein